MLRGTTRILTAALVAVALFAAAAAQAADAPKWVAAIYIQAQKSVGLRWNPVPGATAYKILRSTTQGSGYAEVGSGAQPQLIDADIEPGSTYYYVLQSVAGTEVSPNSDERMVIIPGEKKVEVLTTPTWDKVTLTQTTEFGKTLSKVALFWNVPKGQVVAYNVYRSVAAGKDYQMLASVSENQYVDATPEIGKTYYYVLTALDQNFQETPYSTEQTMEVKAPEKKEEVRAAKKEKIPLLFRRTKLIGTIKSGAFGELRQPTGAAINSRGEVYVAEGLGNRILAFDANGEFLFSWGEAGQADGQINGPLDIAIDDDDNVYVNMLDPRVEIFDASGRPKKTVRFATLLPGGGDHHGGGIACGPDYWYLTDENGCLLLTLEYGSNKLVSTMGKLGDKPGEFRAPKKLLYSRTQKALAVPDTFNFRVQVLRTDKPDDTTVPEAVFGSYGNSVQQFSRLIEVDEDDKGDLITVDFGNSTVQGFGWDGTFKYVLAIADGTEQIGLGGATGIAMRGKRAYITEKLVGRVSILELTDEVGPPAKAPKAAAK